MHQIAIISDIHGNLPALNAVLSDIKDRGIQRIFCLGDIIGKGPHSAQALDIIKSCCEIVVMGNWEYCILNFEEDEKAKWYRNQIGQERLSYLRDLPLYEEFYMSGQLIRLFHAAPNDVFYRIFPKSEANKRAKLFSPTPTLSQPSDIIGYGDIHYAYINHHDGQTAFNTGSVGNPLDLPMASYVILEGVYNSKELSPFNINFVRVPYDIEQAVQDALDTDMLEREMYIKEIRTGIYRKNH